MIGHLIRFKGKGFLVIVLPLVFGIILFLIFDGLSWNDEYVFPASLLLSAFTIWFYDGGPAILREGFGKTPKSRHTFMWIEIKYWALVLGLAGCVLLGTVVKK